MREVFADSGYWVAISVPEDGLHGVARRVASEIEPCLIITTEMVLVEFLNFESKMGAYRRKRAADYVNEIRINDNVEVIPQTSEQFQDAHALYASRLDQRWSLVDCASFVIMQQRGIVEALAYDRDFQQAGFVALLR